MITFKITHIEQDGKIVTNMYTAEDMFRALNQWSETIPDVQNVNQLHVTQ